MNTAVGVIGSGAMGSGIAQVAAIAGHEVVIYDNNSAALERSRQNLSGTLQKLQEKGKLVAADEVMARLRFADSTSAFSGGCRYNPTISSSLAAKSRSGLKVKVRTRCGCNLAPTSMA